MTPDQRDAVTTLLGILREENAELDAQRHDALAGIAERKRAALRELERMPPVASPAPGSAEAVLAASLRAVVEENRCKLRQAIAVQDRIMGVIAGAARQQSARPGYGRTGSAAGTGTGTSPVALSARV